jgi:ribosome-binding factor A
MVERDNQLRKSKLSSLLQSMSAQFFAENTLDWGITGMVLVDDVFMAADLKSAQIWVSFSPHDANKAPGRFKQVEKHQQDLQNYLFKKMEIRQIPKISLRLSDPDKTFKLIDIFGTLEHHADDEPGDSGDTKE